MSWQTLNTNWQRCVAVALLCAVVALSGGSCYAGHEGAKKEPAKKEAAKGEGAPAEAGAADEIKSSGINLGEYKIRSDYPAEAQKSTVRFVIYAAVKAERYDATQKLVEVHSQKIRDEIITATRLAPLGVFEEPDLATFRRRILMRLRRTMPELAFDDLYFSDFGLLVRSL